MNSPELLLLYTIFITIDGTKMKSWNTYKIIYMAENHLTTLLHEWATSQLKLKSETASILLKYTS